MSKRATKCIGQTYADLQGSVIALASLTHEDRYATDPDACIAQMLESGFIKPCSVHPDHYIVNHFRGED